MTNQTALEIRVSKLGEKIRASSDQSNLFSGVAVDTNGLDIMLYQVNFDNFDNSEEALPPVQKPKEPKDK